MSCSPILNGERTNGRGRARAGTETGMLQTKKKDGDAMQRQQAAKAQGFGELPVAAPAPTCSDDQAEAGAAAAMPSPAAAAVGSGEVGGIFPSRHLDVDALYHVEVSVRLRGPGLAFLVQSAGWPLRSDYSALAPSMASATRASHWLTCSTTTTTKGKKGAHFGWTFLHAHRNAPWHAR